MTAAISAGLIASLAAPASAASPLHPSKSVRAPAKVTLPKGIETKIPRSLATARGQVAVFIRLNRQSAVDAYSAKRLSGDAAAAGAAVAARTATKSTAAAVMTALKTHDRTARQLYGTANAVSGIAVVADAGKVRALAVRADVVSISRLVPKKLDNAHSAVLTKVLSTWQSTGLTGRGIRVGIIDSGIDYTHADFGGAATIAAYDAIDRTAKTPAFPSAKVIGGTDLAGENYDASSDDPAQFTPKPDPNPLDCDGHGTHVAGIAAGFGVNGDGSTFKGNYASLTAAKLAAMRVGPGMAPKASLYAIKVFGCPDGANAGSTFLVAPGIDWALDPNGDGNFRDHLDLVNISIGADYSSPDDPDAMFVANAVAHNMLVVTSAGNAGDLYDVGGDVPSALTVASSRDSFNLLDAVEVTAPAAVAGNKPGQVSVAFNYIGFDRTRPVVKMTDATNLDGCKPFNAADKAKVKGKYVWLEWDDNDTTRVCGSAGRSGNAAAAGADGVILTSALEQFDAGITGSTTIPVFQLTASSTVALRPALNAGTLVIRIAGSLVLSFPVNDPSLTDTISSFSSRGTRTPGVKPDISAPGDTIISAGRGTGNLARNLSGTSMASPHVAGIAALVRQAHRGWSAAEVKAAIMATANHDLFSEPNQAPPIYGPNREGTGRVDALGATTTRVIAAVSDSPTTVSVGFGVVEVKAAKMSLSKSITLTNKGSKPATYGATYKAITSMPGVRYTLDRSRVTVPAHGTAKVK
ncbi:MAG TPA: S8 family serine peptidase, partial [Candidatus Limnocylindrales bacterium]|nr:S8 family serine peptidase [Candidatus Limnocylindrales bacterium]